MTKEDLFEAIGGIDDEALVMGDAVVSSDRRSAGIFSRETGTKTNRLSFVAKRWIAAAACLVLVVTGVLAARGISSKWRMGSSGNMAMQKSMDGSMEAADEAIYDSAASIAYNEAEGEKVLAYGAIDGVEDLIISNVAIQIERVERETGQVELSEDMRSLVLNMLSKETEGVEEEAAAEEDYEDNGRATVPAAGGQTTTEAEQGEVSALFILTFEQSDTTYVATLYDDRTLVFDDDALATIFLTEDEYDRLLFALQEVRLDQNK